MAKGLENSLNENKGKSLFRGLRKVLIAGATAAAFLGCSISPEPPKQLTPPLTRVYEGNNYGYLMQFSGGDSYSINVVPKTSGAPNWSMNVTPESNGVYIDGGVAPSVTADSDYDVKVLATNNYGTTEVDYTLTDVNVTTP